ncbi:MAG: prepilin-type N-terminal cleavage/methylation domain-containing protein [Fibrobacter sp.]|nr:prepilin-type N-terminal cleavage/methylation domain-containing protein [Fibrobacter sp.]MDY6390899.1 prepilin-type N-terminal cleavage/methylation domain-containing protein [Fibrobacter sp.]
MKKTILTKKGFTLVEVLAVVAIIGILSAAGYANLRQAIANSRVKDAAFNIAAFAETAANKAKQISDTVCVKAKVDTLFAYKSSCALASDNSTILDRLEMPTGVKIVTSSANALEGSNWNSGDGAEFVPRFGLSAAPQKGYFLVRYLESDLYGSAVKVEHRNSFVSKISYDGTTWSDL